MEITPPLSSLSPTTTRAVPRAISKTPRLLNTLENTFYPLDMLQVGFKRVSRSNLHNLMQTFSRDFFFFKLGLYPFLHLFSLFCTFSCLTHPSKLIMRKKVRPSDGQVVSSTHQAKQKWSQVKSRLYLNVLLLQNYYYYCPTHHSPLPRALLLSRVLLPRVLLPRALLPLALLPHALLPPRLLLPLALLPLPLLPRALLPRALLPRALLPRVLLPRALLPRALLPRALLPRALLPRALLPRALLPRALLPRTLLLLLPCMLLLLPRALLLLPRTPLLPLAAAAAAPRTSTA